METQSASLLAETNPSRVARPLVVRVFRLVMKRGLRYTLMAAVEKYWPHTIRNYKIYRANLFGKYGLEIGVPTSHFGSYGILPIYPIVANLDGCNFSRSTIWEGTIEEGQTFQYDRRKPKGYQYIRDAVDLSAIETKYDFVAASHAVEHIANPLKAIAAWLRVLKDDGILLLIVPHKDRMFDRRRPVTRFQHLLDDFEHSTPEDDLTHLPEVLELHDLALDPQAGDFESFKQRSHDNYRQRGLHHHVFDTALVVRLFDHFNLQIIAVDPVLPHHIIIMGKKLPGGQKARNSAYLGSDATFRRTSPFQSDRKQSIG
jgi:SAM-dependent methyltransferase